MFVSIWEDLVSIWTHIIPSSNSSVPNKSLCSILSCSLSIRAPNVKCSRLHNSLEMVLPFLVWSIVLSLFHKIKRTAYTGNLFTSYVLLEFLIIDNMLSEITEETEEEPHWFFNTEDQKEKIRKIIQYQKSLYWSSSSLSSSAASSASSSHKSSSLLELMKGGSTSMRRLFDMEHTSLSTHFDYYSGSPIIKPISLWDSDSEREFQDPWALIKQIGSTNFAGTDRESELASKGSHIDADFGSQKNRNDKKTGKRKLTRKKSFRRLPGFGLWRCGRFRFPLRLRRLKFRILGRKFR